MLATLDCSVCHRRTVATRLLATVLVAGLATSGCAATVTEVAKTRYEAGTTNKKVNVADADSTLLRTQCVGTKVEIRANNFKNCQLETTQHYKIVDVKTTKKKDGTENNAHTSSIILGIGLGVLGAYYFVDAPSRPETAPPLPSHCAQYTSTSENVPSECNSPATRGQAYGLAALSTGLGLLFTWIGLSDYATGLGRTEQVVGKDSAVLSRVAARCAATDPYPLMVKVKWPGGAEQVVDLNNGSGVAELPAVDQRKLWHVADHIQVEAGADTAQLAVRDCSAAIEAIEAHEAAQQQERRRQEAEADRLAREAEEQRQAEQAAERQAAAAQQEVASADPQAELLDIWDSQRGEVLRVTPLDGNSWEVWTDKGETWLTLDGGMNWTKKAGPKLQFVKEIATAGAPLRLTIADNELRIGRGEFGLVKCAIPAEAQPAKVQDADGFPASKGIVAALTTDRGLQLMDADCRWTIAAGAKDLQPSAVFLRGQGGQIVLVQDKFGGVWRSTDAGGSFEKVAALSSAGPIAVISGAPGRVPDLFAVTTSGQWFAGFDNGGRWIGLGAPGDADLGEVLNLAVHPRYAGTIGALYRGGVVWSFNGGRKWQRARGVSRASLEDARGMRWVGSTAVVWGGRKTGFKRLASVQERVTFSEQVAAGASGRLLFATGSAALQGDALSQLKPLAQRMVEHPRLIARIEGHTDAQGQMDANLRLSLDRADSVRKALVLLGVDGARLSTAGLGPTRPLGPNDAQGKSGQNRRVEIVLMVP